MEFAVEATGLHKTFAKKKSVKQLLTGPFRRAERVHALRGVDLRVERGEIFGLLGPNGAGKTTMLKIFSCLVLPDRGTARIDGVDTLHERRVKPRIGLVHSDERSFYWRLSGRENLRFFATLYDVPSGEVERRIDALLERVDMVEPADRRFSDYSSGMKQRMAIARAMLHDPPILLMDEPTRSLDPASALVLRRFIKDKLSLTDRKTILLATHNLREAEALCDRVAILVRGRMRQVGTIPEVRRWGMQERRFRLVLSDWPPELERRYRAVEDRPVDQGRQVTVAFEGRDQHYLDELIRALVGAQVSIRSCEREEPDLEDAFSRILASEGAAVE